MRLSVVYPNAYPGKHYVEFALRNLAAQTCQDFEIVIVDMAYAENKDTVIELCESLHLRDVVHVPACEARHVGRLMHWDLYNNAALLASSPWILFYGLKRYIHKRVIETILYRTGTGFCTNLFQIRPDESVTIDTVGYNFDGIEDTYSLNVETRQMHYLAQTGFFSIPADIYIEVLNGYNEALLVQHWVDNEMNARIIKVPLLACNMARGMLRLNSTLGYGAVPVGKPICQRAIESDCIRHKMNLRSAENIKVENAERFVHDGFEWIRCPDCGTLAVDKEFDYMEYASRPGHVKAPVNVHGVGRNLSRIADDLNGLDITDKVNILISSHTNPRYLES